MNQLLLGETQILAGAIITSAGQQFGSALAINAPNAVVDLAVALQQPRTASNGLNVFVGTFTTNNQPVRVRSLLSNPMPGV